MRKCEQMLNITDIISKKTNDFTEYWWYNEVGIYEKDSFLEFYDYLIKTGNHSTMLNDTEYFDYMLYSIWLLAFKDFKSVNLLPNRKFVYGGVEDSFHDNTISYAYRFMEDANKNHKDIPHIKIRVNIDRGNNENLYQTVYGEIKL